MRTTRGIFYTSKLLNLPSPDVRLQTFPPSSRTAVTPDNKKLIFFEHDLWLYRLISSEAFAMYGKGRGEERKEGRLPPLYFLFLSCSLARSRGARLIFFPNKND